MSESQLIAAYEAVNALTGRMVDAAREADWDRVTELERQCRSLVDDLMAGNAPAPLSPALHRRKVELIHQVLANDAEIRRLAQPWMARLESMLGSLHNRHRLNRAYGSEL